MYSVYRLWLSSPLHLDTATELFRAYVAHFLPCPVTLVFPTFIFIYGAPPLPERRVTCCMRPLRCLAFCQRVNGPWQDDSWLPPLSPVISSRLLYCVSLPPWQQVWTLTGYFGLKFQHPSVRANKHYLKGQQKARERHR